MKIKPGLLQVINNKAEINDFVTNSWRPYGFIENEYGLLIPVDDRGAPLVTNESDLRANAFLSREEWQSLDNVVYGMAKQKLNAWADLVAAGLTRPSDVATWYTKWGVSSEQIGANVTMEFETFLSHDRTDRKWYGVPLPIVSRFYSIGRRELASLRRAGQAIESTEAMEATGAVVEKLEDILLNGSTDVTIEGGTIPGYTTLTGRETGAAAAYGGGDFGTISNIHPTFRGLLSALALTRFRGPFVCYLAPTQYWEMQAVYTDGSGQTALQRVLQIPEIQAIKENDLVTAGEMIATQMSRDVVDLEIAISIENRQWESPDASRMYFVVLAAAVPRCKVNYAGDAGIGHVTGI